MGDGPGGDWPLRYLIVTGVLHGASCKDTWKGPQISHFLFRGGPMQETILPLQLLCVLPKHGRWFRFQFAAHHYFSAARVGVVLQAG